MTFMNFDSIKQELLIENQNFSFFNLELLNKEKYTSLPYCLRIILESLIRKYDGIQITQKHVDILLNWSENINKRIKFLPSRVILQDFSSIPALIDFATIRNVVDSHGGSADQVNPACLTDLILDHALADGAKKIVLPKGPNGSDLTIETGYIQCPIHNLRTECADLIERNRSLEFDRCKERLSLLKWSSKSFQNVLVVPPFNGISHQTNIECLARVVLNNNGLLYPESIIGTDSNTCLSNAFGILSFNSCAIQCENVLLGKSVDFCIPEIIGYKIVGSLNDHVNSIDVILAITKHLRSLNLRNTIVEFTGNSVSELTVSERETICNICADYGALIGYFPMDDVCIQYLKKTGRSDFNITCIEQYFKKSGIFKNENYSIKYSNQIDFDLSTIRPLCSGPKKVADKFELENLSSHFKNFLVKPSNEGGYGLNEFSSTRKFIFNYKQEQFELSNGSVLIASIASYTNSSNPSVILGAALLAKKAFELGLKIRPFIRRTCFPGSGLLTKNYLVKSGLLKYFELLGFNIVGYGCSQCIDNEIDVDKSLVDFVKSNELVCTGVLSGNKNFENRINTVATKANFLVSPGLVVAYALAGTININFEKEPIQVTDDKREIFLKDIWPTREEISSLEMNVITPEIYKNIEKQLWCGSDDWHSLIIPKTNLFKWDPASTYIKQAPFLDSLYVETKINPIRNAHVLLYLEDSITSDHISPAGSIARTSSAAKYLVQNKVQPRDFNSYGSRRGNHEVMSRGTFSNLRLVNKLAKQVGSAKTLYIPKMNEMDIYDAAKQYKTDGIPVIVIAGKDYGCGPSRDWSIKGQLMLGIRAIIAESFDQNHRSNLVCMGILPLLFKNGDTAKSFGLNGKEQYSILIDDSLNFKQTIDVVVNNKFKFQVEACIYDQSELLYFKNSGLLNYFTRKYL